MPNLKPWIAEVLERLKKIMVEHGLRDTTAKDLSRKLLRGAVDGGELNERNIEEWFLRLNYQLVWLDADEYARALIRGLYLAPTYSSVDFRTGGERDLVQVWADSTRGELGEIGFVKFLRDRFGVEAHVDKTRGPVEKFLSRDITKVRKKGEDWRDAGVKISVKNTKFQGAWLELPGAQIKHSDVYVLTRSGLPNAHMVSFFKHISIIREKLLPLARKLGELTENGEKELLDLIPEFEAPPVYVVGFVDREKLNLQTPNIVACRLAGRKEKRIEIYRGIGIFSEELLRNHPKIKEIDQSNGYPIRIVPIKDKPNGSFLADGGSLTWGRENWESLISRL